MVMNPRENNFDCFLTFCFQPFLPSWHDLKIIQCRNNHIIHLLDRLAIRQGNFQMAKTHLSLGGCLLDVEAISDGLRDRFSIHRFLAQNCNLFIE